MGPLILPTGGMVYVDANVVIYSVEPRWAVPPPAGPDVGRGQGGSIHFSK